MQARGFVFNWVTSTPAFNLRSIHHGPGQRDTFTKTRSSERRGGWPIHLKVSICIHSTILPGRETPLPKPAFRKSVYRKRFLITSWVVRSLRKRVRLCIAKRMQESTKQGPLNENALCVATRPCPFSFKPLSLFWGPATRRRPRRCSRLSRKRLA